MCVHSLQIKNKLIMFFNNLMKNIVDDIRLSPRSRAVQTYVRKILKL